MSVTALATSLPDASVPVNTSPYWSTNRVPPGSENTQSGGYWSPGSSTTLNPADPAAAISSLTPWMYEVENVPLSGSASFQPTEMVTESTPAAASWAKFGSLGPTTPRRGGGP